MPFKSTAQRKYFRILEELGEIPHGTSDIWEEETGNTQLPQHVNTDEENEEDSKKLELKKPHTKEKREK